MEDRGKECQDKLKGCLPAYQVIFATSNIAPELEKPEYVIGEYNTQQNKSLKNV